jgi:uncharacterized protein YndB with AHSA1/START domain
VGLFVAAVMGPLFLLGGTFDMFDEMNKIWRWSKPEPYPSNLAELDVNTLSVLLDSGNLQWYEPRPEEKKWDAVVGMKVHAPVETVWEVFTDPLLPCRIMDKTFKKCELEWEKENQAKVNYVLETRVLQFGSIFSMNDVITKDPPYHLHMSTVEGGLKGREVDVQLIPIEGGRAALVFMRYFAHMESLGLTIQTVLKVLPDSEWPVAAASANYHLREHKKEAERRAGYKPPAQPAALRYEALDVEALAWLDRYKAGLIRETYEGKDINGLAFAFIEAPPERVYALISDLEHYNDHFKNQVTEVEKREGNQVWVQQKITSQSVLIFTFAYEMHALYTLDPPYHVSYRCMDGTYEGSTGDYQILPLEGGNRSILFAAIGINFERDQGLTARLIRSGDYPFNTVMNLLAARSYLNTFKPAAEK